MCKRQKVTEIGILDAELFIFDNHGDTTKPRKDLAKCITLHGDFDPNTGSGINCTERFRVRSVSLTEGEYFTNINDAIKRYNEL